jgi:hypothetical protein
MAAENERQAPPPCRPDTADTRLWWSRRRGIMEFLESRIGAFDMFVEVENGEPFIHYCFELEADAEAFHAMFGPAADRAVVNKAV